jgi:hypothetical protein
LKNGHFLAATPYLPASSSSFGSALMSYQHYLYQMQNITQSSSGYQNWPPPTTAAHSNLGISLTFPSNTPMMDSSCTHAITDTTESSISNRGGSPDIEPCEFPLQSRVDVEQKQAIQQAGYPPRSVGCALEPSASTQYYYNPPAHCGGNHFSHQETTSTTQESQPRVITQGYEPKGTSDDDIDESYDDDFLSFLTRL